MQLPPHPLGSYSPTNTSCHLDVFSLYSLLIFPLLIHFLYQKNLLNNLQNYSFSVGYLNHQDKPSNYTSCTKFYMMKLTPHQIYRIKYAELEGTLRIIVWSHSIVYPELDRIHKDHEVQLPALHRMSQIFYHMLDNVVQIHFGAATTSLGSLLQCPTTL